MQSLVMEALVVLALVHLQTTRDINPTNQKEVDLEDSTETTLQVKNPKSHLEMIPVDLNKKSNL